MKTYLLIATACLSLIACNENKTASKELDTIPLGVAFETPTDLKASECFKQIRYIPLETNDSCLIGAAPSIKILHDKLVVTTAQKQCLLFDKATGHFLSSVGHIGNDPEGYSSINGYWLDYPNDRIVFAGWNNEQVVYNSNSSYATKFKVPIEKAEFPATTVSNYIDGQTLVAHTSAAKGKPDQITVFRDSAIINQFFPTGTDSLSYKVNPEDIESISIISNHGFGPGMMFISYKNNAEGAYPLGDHFFWHQGKDAFFKEQFNDTIYQVTEKALLPVRYLDLAAYHWEVEKRFDKEKSHAIYPTEILEGENGILIRFITDLYNKRMVYNAFFDKKSGIVKVSDYTKAIENDLNGFLPLQPVSVSPKGEFAQIISAEEVVSWFEEHTNSGDIPAEVATLKKVGEEDNPVVVIME